MAFHILEDTAKFLLLNLFWIKRWKNSEMYPEKALIIFDWHSHLLWIFDLLNSGKLGKKRGFASFSWQYQISSSYWKHISVHLSYCIIMWHEYLQCGWKVWHILILEERNKQLEHWFYCSYYWFLLLFTWVNHTQPSSCKKTILRVKSWHKKFSNQQHRRGTFTSLLSFICYRCTEFKKKPNPPF